MQLSFTEPPPIIPSYSLTGDLLAYLKCGLQYRYHNKGRLPPSKPVQLWFGEFIHAIMEEAYLRYSRDRAPRAFPWNWEDDIRPIELEIDRRLRARGLVAPYQLFCPYETNGDNCSCRGPTQQPHQLLASRRTEAAVNTWGAHLFPLISEPEVPLRSIRPMPVEGQRRADYYEVTGIVDVIGSVQFSEAPPGNLILHHMNNDTDFCNMITDLSDSQYEIILDYKGMRRSPTTSPAWQHYAWQVLTYAWLRAQQPNAARVIAGIVLFINELEPSGEDMKDLQQDVQLQRTDIMPSRHDRQAIMNWRPRQEVPRLTRQFCEKRSIRVITVETNNIDRSLREFDNVVRDMESSVLTEMTGQRILNAWQVRPSGAPYIAPEDRTCTACDFKHYCPLAPRVGEGGPPNAP